MSEQKTVLVTGSSRGLGAVIAKQFGEKGYKVVVNYFKSKEKALKVVEEIGEGNAIAIQADVRNKQQVEAMVKKATEQFGPIDIVVNNALINFEFNPVTQGAVEELTWENYNEQLQGTVQSALNTIQAVLPGMKKQGYGRIINIGTNLFQNPVVPYHQYTTAKAALIGFTRNMAKELGKDQITVNMVSGGLLERTDASAVTTPEVFDLIAASSALNRVTEPTDVAEVVVFLGSEASRGVTGQNIVVDSGLTMN
ncbi:3-oxoacyl-ACP reductase [Marinilactibacillus sp. XAAS-LB27]|uniref:3-oxoacyl-ACP reductase n=1 Tax=Marinilactibacillus sp. XAAS-LB27 TaxID=3114538 RepID=UPI002E19B7CD|nr:3-oxoacyl-ACP reductase [Marinilactibacillus sp. XAAS-LB27]